MSVTLSPVPVRMTAGDVLASLHTRWPDADYLAIPEAPDGPNRRGCKIDLLIVSLWQTRGFELDAVEIKVSAGDWRREVANPGKSAFWRRHAHRFWIAAPLPLTATIRPDLPAGWGLIGCATEGERTTTVVRARKATPVPLSWPETVGLLRAAADCGYSALHRADARGYERGRLHGLTEGGQAGQESTSWVT